MSPKEWKQTEATIQSSHQEHCHVAAGGGFAGKEYMIAFRYEVDGRGYLGEFESPEPFETGSKLCIEYDPDEPERNTMCDRGQDRWVYIALVIAAIVAIAAYFWVAYSHIH